MSKSPSLKACETLLTVHCVVTASPFALQPDGEGVDEGLFVFDDEHFDAWFAGWAFGH